MIVGDEAPPPSQDKIVEGAFCAETAAEAERMAKALLGMGEPAN
jgi:hypothetical protein